MRVCEKQIIRLTVHNKIALFAEGPRSKSGIKVISRVFRRKSGGSSYAKVKRTLGMSRNCPSSFSFSLLCSCIEVSFIDVFPCHPPPPAAVSRYVLPAEQSNLRSIKLYDTFAILRGVSFVRPGYVRIIGEKRVSAANTSYTVKYYAICTWQRRRHMRYRANSLYARDIEKQSLPNIVSPRWQRTGIFLGLF